jgi:dihydropteridine reductase
VLVGAAAATSPTPGMIAYGLAKASVHHLVKSAADKDSGLPVGSKVVGLLPYVSFFISLCRIMLDTPMNRKWMPDADTDTWTPLPEIAAYVFYQRLKH